MSLSDLLALVLAFLSTGMCVMTLTGAGRGVRAGGGLRGAAMESALAGVDAWARSLPLVRAHREREEYQELRSRCLREMPELLDIVTLGLAAGLSFDASLELYCGRFDTSVARAFTRAMRSWQIGLTTRAKALEGLASRLDLAALRSFSDVVNEALTFGIPLVDVLTRQADEIREEQRMQVEEQIEKVPIKMLVPLGTLVLPAMLLAILGPLLSSALHMG